MSRTTDECLTLARRALEVGQQCLPSFSHPCSPKKFTQPQLFAILTIRQALRWSFRATVTRLGEWSDLRDVLQLSEVPDQSTLCHAHHRLFSEKTSIGFLMQASIRPESEA